MISRRALMTRGSAATSRARPDSTGGAVRCAGAHPRCLRRPGFDELAGQVAAGGDEECAGAHRDVGDPQGEDLLGGPEFPRRAVGRLQRARAVDQGLQGAFGDLLGEEPGRVVGAGRARSADSVTYSWRRGGSPRGRRAGPGG